MERVRDYGYRYDARAMCADENMTPCGACHGILLCEFPKATNGRAVHYALGEGGDSLLAPSQAGPVRWDLLPIYNISNENQYNTVNGVTIRRLRRVSLKSSDWLKSAFTAQQRQQLRARTRQLIREVHDALLWPLAGGSCGSRAHIDNHLDGACTIISTVQIMTCSCGDWHAGHDVRSQGAHPCGSGRAPADAKDAGRFSS
eukprot:1295549-Amphidinium_carterae.1